MSRHSNVFFTALCALALAGCTLQAGVESAPTLPPTVGIAEQPPSDTPSSGPPEMPEMVTSTSTASPDEPTASRTSSPTPRLPTGAAIPQTTPAPAQRATATLTPDDTLSIEYFTVSPEEVYPGEMVTLSWKVRGAVRRIETIKENNVYGPFFNDLPEEGTLDVVIPAESRQRMTFLLVVGKPNPSLEAISEQITIRLLCPDEWFFEPAPEACPRAATTTQAAVQEFEHGRMLWRTSDLMIYVMFEDTGQPSYITLSDPWAPGLPESDPAIVPPSGYYQPVRGFGRVWRESFGVRDRLGWALSSEAEFEMTYQCDSTWHGRANYTYCYVSGPEGELYRFGPAGWEIVADSE